MKKIIKIAVISALIVVISVIMIGMCTFAESMDETVAKIVADSKIFENAETIKYSFDEKENILTVYSIKEFDTQFGKVDYIADSVKVKIAEEGVMHYIQTTDPSNLSPDEARAIIAKRMWLFYTDLYNNTAMLDFTRTPITDVDGIEKYPLLDDFSTEAKFTEYLKTIFTENVAMHYLEDTSITIFGNELYDIGGKVAQFTFDYENFQLEEIFTAESKAWHLYRVTVKFDNDMNDLADTYDDFFIGIFNTENGWRIAQTSLKNESELLYFGTYDNKATDENNHKNPSTADTSVIVPFIMSISFIGSLLSLKKIIETER